LHSVLSRKLPTLRAEIHPSLKLTSLSTAKRMRGNSYSRDLTRLQGKWHGIGRLRAFFWRSRQLRGGVALSIAKTAHPSPTDSSQGSANMNA
jgi:hypothetical protein